MASTRKTAHRWFDQCSSQGLVAACARQVMGRDVVVSDDIGEVVPGRPRPAVRSMMRRRLVLARSHFARKLAIGHVADKSVPEEVLDLAFQRRSHDRTYEVALSKRTHGAIDRVRLAAGERRYGAAPEGLSDDGGVAEKLLLLGGQCVKSSSEYCLDRVGDGKTFVRLETNAPRGAHDQAAVEQKAHVLLRVERIAAYPLEDADGFRRSRLRAEQLRDECADIHLGEGGQGDTARAPGASRGREETHMLLQKLGTGRGDDEQRGLEVLGQQMLDESEHRIAGPVQVLDDDDGGTLRSDDLKHASPGDVVLPLGGARRFEAEQRTQTLTQPGSVLALG